jgi:hypothetical protein
VTTKTMSYDDYLRLVGLLKLASDHRAILELLDRSARALTGDKPLGHTSDAVWGRDYSPEELLSLLNIPLPVPPTTPAESSRMQERAMRIIKQFDEGTEE